MNRRKMKILRTLILMIFLLKNKTVKSTSMIRKQHFGVYCLVFTPENQLALIEKTRGPYTGLLDLPGGSVEYGEGIEQALEREILEELGIVLPGYELKFVTSFNYAYEEEGHPANLFHIAIIYEARLPKKVALNTTVSDLDSREAHWELFETLKPAALSPLVQNVLKKYHEDKK